MKALLLGGGGMLGRSVLRTLAPETRLTATYRGSAPRERPAGVTIIEGADLSQPQVLDQLIETAAPDVVINCAGLIKQRAEAADPIKAIEMNALLPHRIAGLCQAREARFIHISTDCIFSGARDSVRGPNGYTEEDRPDPVDLYGRSKWLGEVSGPGLLTLRMSLVGREGGSRLGLLEWFLAARGDVFGYVNTLFTGLATPVAADLIARIIGSHPDLDGLWHAAAAPISKLELLRCIRHRAQIDVTINPREDVWCDRRLDGTRLSARLNWHPPGWDEMVARMLAQDAA